MRFSGEGFYPGGGNHSAFPCRVASETLQSLCKLHAVRRGEVNVDGESMAGGTIRFVCEESREVVDEAHIFLVQLQSPVLHAMLASLMRESGGGAPFREAVSAW